MESVSSYPRTYARPEPGWPDLTPLQTRGFVVIRGFLSAADIAACVAAFEVQPLADNAN